MTFQILAQEDPTPFTDLSDALGGGLYALLLVILTGIFAWGAFKVAAGKQRAPAIIASLFILAMFAVPSLGDSLVNFAANLAERILGQADQEIEGEG